MLRNYQIEYHNKTIESIKSSEKNKEKCRTIVVLPTGGGKSKLIQELIAHIIIKNKYVLFLTHRKELINITKKNCDEYGITYNTKNAKVIICGVLSYNKYMQRFNISPNLINTIIVDEAHHIMSNCYLEIVNKHINYSHIIGYTATPTRLDKKLLSTVFNKIINLYTLQDLTDLRYLCKFVVYKSNQSLDVFKNLRISGNDYDLEEVFIKIKRSISYKCVLDHFLTVQNAKGIAFCPTIEYAQEIVKYFNAKGIQSEYVSHKTPKAERIDIFNRFKNSEIKCLFNVELFTEGIDIPDCNLLLNMRPTKSVVLWHQMIGRVVRISPNKWISHIFDFTSNWHDLPFPNDIMWELDTVKIDKKKRHTPTKISFRKDIIFVNDILYTLDEKLNVLEYINNIKRRNLR